MGHRHDVLGSCKLLTLSCTGLLVMLGMVIGLLGWHLLHGVGGKYLCQMSE